MIRVNRIFQLFPAFFSILNINECALFKKFMLITLFNNNEWPPWLSFFLSLLHALVMNYHAHSPWKCVCVSRQKKLQLFRRSNKIAQKCDEKPDETAVTSAISCGLGNSFFGVVIWAVRCEKATWRSRCVLRYRQSKIDNRCKTDTLTVRKIPILCLYKRSVKTVCNETNVASKFSMTLINSLLIRTGSSMLLTG